MHRRATSLSKFLSLVLRHQPQKIDISLDSDGWVDIDVLLAALERNGRAVSRADLEQVVEENNKKRFKIQDGKIRANQGHSVKISLGLEPIEPPLTLFHGTATRFVDAILEQGLRKMKRHHVHLSQDENTAMKVGARHGKVVILLVDSGRMFKDGKQFFVSDNGVWLTESVAPEYIEVKSNAV